MAHPETQRVFGERVKQIRERQGMTLRQLAEHSGVPRQMLWKIETGRQRNSSLFTAARIAKALHVSLDYLAGIYEESELLALGLALAQRYASPRG